LFLKRKYDFNSQSDQELLSFYKLKEDNQVIAEFYERYSHLVFGLCMKYLKNVQNAEDLTIELFADLNEKIKKHEISHFKSWLYTTTKNSCLMVLRKKNFKTSSFEEQFENKAEDENLSSKEILELRLDALENALQELSKNQSLCITAFYLQKKSYDEICKSQNLTLNEVKSHIQNGKRNLKIILSNLISEK
jgi:RNA polymerase sigma-70 factor (ECF subfamily)